MYHTIHPFIYLCVHQKWDTEQHGSRIDIAASTRFISTWSIADEFSQCSRFKMARHIFSTLSFIFLINIQIIRLLTVHQFIEDVKQDAIHLCNSTVQNVTLWKYPTLCQTNQLKLNSMYKPWLVCILCSPSDLCDAFIEFLLQWNELTNFLLPNIYQEQHQFGCNPINTLNYTYLQYKVRSRIRWVHSIPVESVQNI